MDRVKENVIEWIENEDTALCTFSQKKFVNRIRRMVENRTPCVKILVENPDGSILARIPLSAVHITVYAPRKGQFYGVRKNEKKA